MEQLLCEPEDRLGSQASASVSRPDSLVIQARRSGFINPNLVGKGSVDGVELIKVCFAVLVSLPKPQGMVPAVDDIFLPPSSLLFLFG